MTSGAAIPFRKMNGLGNEIVRFRARFGAATYDVSVPIAAVLGIYARETGQGMALPPEDDMPAAPGDAPAPSPNDDDTPPDDGGNEPPKRGGHLRIVK